MRRPATARKTRTMLTAAAVAATLLLAGCGSDEPEDAGTETPDPAATDTAAEPEASAEDVAALEAVEVEGDLGSAPELVFDQPFEVSAPVARVETEGTGAAVEEGQQVALHYVAVSGDDGTSLGSTWDVDQPQRLTVGDPTIIGALNDVLLDSSVGTRLLYAAPGTPAIEETEEMPAVPATPATLMAIEVVEARDIPTRAEGEAVEPADGLPVVTLAEDGEPSIEIPADAEEPTELVVQPLIEGDGPVVQAGQNVSIHYTGWLWDGTEFDSSWDRGQPLQAPIGVGNLIVGWDEGVVGQTVGSQVLLVVPADMGYGEEGYNDIPGGATLIFVVDILDAI